MRSTDPARLEARRRALRVAAVIAGLSAPLAGCDGLVARVMQGRALDGTPCVGWSVSHGSPASCCADEGGTWDPAAGSCDVPVVDYGIVEGPFVPPADPQESLG